MLVEDRRFGQKRPIIELKYWVRTMKGPSCSSFVHRKAADRRCDDELVPIWPKNIVELPKQIFHLSGI